MKRFLVFAVFSIPLLAQGQQASVPPADGVDMKTDLVYATHGTRRMHLDLYLPTTGRGPFPSVIYIHGAGTTQKQFSGQAAYMATRGFVGVCIEYRSPDEAKYPAALNDSVDATHWVQEHAREYNIDPARIGTAGGSAGGHLSALLGTMKERIVKAVVAFNPVVDLVSIGEGKASSRTQNYMSGFLGATYATNPKLWEEASPLARVNKESAPFLLLHGDADAAIPYQQSVEMMNQLRAAGVPAEIFIAKGGGHGFFNGPPWFDETKERMAEFFMKYLNSN